MFYSQTPRANWYLTLQCTWNVIRGKETEALRGEAACLDPLAEQQQFQDGQSRPSYHNYLFYIPVIGVVVSEVDA